MFKTIYRFFRKPGSTNSLFGDFLILLELFWGCRGGLLVAFEMMFGQFVGQSVERNFRENPLKSLLKTLFNAFKKALKGPNKPPRGKNKEEL